VNNGIGDIWLADLWGNRIERYTRNAGGYTYAQTIGAVMPPRMTNTFQETRQVAVGADGIVNAIDTGTTTRAWTATATSWRSAASARPGRGARQVQLAARPGFIDNATNQIWSPTRSRTASRSCSPIAAWFSGFEGGADPDQFNWPYGVAIRQSDRIVLRVGHAEQPPSRRTTCPRALLDSTGGKGTGFWQMGSRLVSP
jgi:hypothetical protein